MLDIRVRVRGVYIWGEELENKTKKKNKSMQIAILLNDLFDPITIFFQQVGLNLVVDRLDVNDLLLANGLEDGAHGVLTGLLVSSEGGFDLVGEVLVLWKVKVFTDVTRFVVHEGECSVSNVDQHEFGTGDVWDLRKIERGGGWVSLYFMEGTAKRRKEKKRQTENKKTQLRGGKNC